MKDSENMAILEKALADFQSEVKITKDETLRTILICGTICRIKELIRIYEAGEKKPSVILEYIQKTIDYANEIYRKSANKEEA